MVPGYLVDFDLDKLPQVSTDVIIIGAGIAGLFSALKLSKQHRVVLITKKSLLDSNTRYAQGGIAAVIAETDSPQFHMDDTLMAGAGLCETDAVEIMVNEGPLGVQDLIELGTKFDIENGEFALTKEGAHSQRRILHANGDATGFEIVRALSKKALENKNIEVWDNHFVIDLITDNNECVGALVQKENGERIYLKGNATVLCSGGCGQLYRYTTNPDVATADGVAMAYRAGANVRDMEFVQFHPTSLCYPGAPRFLISEAVRGEGGILRNIRGERFMEKYDALLELAPRDIVARAIVSELEQTNATFVYIDITHKSEQFIKHRFPTIHKYCLDYGLDMTTDWIPVAPAMHYMMGGVETDLNGQTSITRLFACGEVSSTGVHGANRLASNSLSEAIVFGRRIVEQINQLATLQHDGGITVQMNRNTPLMQPVVEKRLKLQRVMVRYVGLKRSADGLQQCMQELNRQLPIFEAQLNEREEFEFANLLTCGLLTTVSAWYREESRGGHYRVDFPQRDDNSWLKHTVLNRHHSPIEEVAIHV